MSAGVLAVVYWPSHSAVLSVHTATLSWSFRTPRGFAYSGLSAAQAFSECFQILPQQAQEPRSLGFGHRNERPRPVFCISYFPVIVI